MFPKCLLALTLFAALAVMPPCVLRAQWVQTSSINGGDVFAIAQSGGELYAVGYPQNGTGSCYLSTDTGTTWNLFKIEDTSVIDIGCSCPYLFAWTRDSFFVSKDYGASWHGNVKEVENEGYLVTMGENIFSAAAGIYRSDDGGSNWVALDTDTQFRQTGIHGITTIGNMIFVAADDGVFRSTDSGIAWATVFDSVDGPYGRYQAGVTSIASEGTTLIISTDGYQILRSTDSGITWVCTDSNGNLAYSVIANAGVLYYGNLRSIDSGLSWAPLTSLGVNEIDGYQICVAQDGDYTFFGGADGILRSTDSGETGQLIGLPDVEISSLFASGDNIFASTYQGIYTSADQAESWQLPSLLNNGGVFSSPYPNGTALFLSGQTGGYTDTGWLYRSSDNGRSWTMSSFPHFELTSIMQFGGYLFAPVLPLAPSPGSIKSIFRSSDSGNTWIASSNGISASYGGRIFGVTGGRLIYAAGSDTNLSVYTYYSSNNFGESWTPIDTNQLCCPLPEPCAEIGAIIFGIDSGILYRSTDRGVSWVLNDTLLSIDPPNILSAAAIDSSLFVSTSDGSIFLSTNSGMSWRSVRDNLTDSIITVVADSNYLFAAAASDRIYRRPLSDFGISSVEQTPVVARQEIQIFPNPFSRSTQITFTSQAAGYAEVSIVNMLGVEVARLFSGELGAGEHSFLWGNPTGLPGLPDGTYECLVRMNGQVETLPMVLMR